MSDELARILKRNMTPPVVIVASFVGGVLLIAGGAFFLWEDWLIAGSSFPLGYWLGASILLSGYGILDNAADRFRINRLLIEIREATGLGDEA